MDDKERDKFLALLDTLGVDAVRLTLAGNDWHVEREPSKRRLAEHWLKSKDDASVALAEARRDAREEETLSIAREANRIAERALSKATTANVWAAIAALIAAIAIYAAIFIDKS